MRGGERRGGAGQGEEHSGHMAAVRRVLGQAEREAARDRQTTVKHRHALVRIKSGPLSDPRKS